jgi:hypothetical protein
MTTGTPIANYAYTGIGGGGPGPGGKGGGGGFNAQGAAINVGGNTALYLTEINTGRFGIYTMTPALDGTGKVMIRRHDASLFRAPTPAP